MTKDATKGLKLPPIFQTLHDRPRPDFNFEDSAFNPEFSWLKYGDEPTEAQVESVTKRLVKWHMDQRMRIFHNLGRTRPVTKVREFLRHYTDPPNTRKKRFGAACRRPQKSKKYRLDEWAFRTPEDTLREQEKVREHLRKMIEADLRRVEREKEEQARKEEEKRKKALRAKKAAANRVKLNGLPNIQYMQQLKKKEMK